MALVDLRVAIVLFQHNHVVIPALFWLRRIIVPWMCSDSIDVIRRSYFFIAGVMPIQQQCFYHCIYLFTVLVLGRTVLKINSKDIQALLNATLVPFSYIFIKFHILLQFICLCVSLSFYPEASVSKGVLLKVRPPSNSDNGVGNGKMVTTY